MSFTVKICQQCHVEKEILFFGVRKDIKGGFSNKCKLCRSLSSKAAILLSPEKRKARSLRNYLSNKEKIDDCIKKWRMENKDKVQHYYATNYVRNKEKINARSIAIAKKHKDAIDENYAKALIATEIRKLGFHGVSVNLIHHELVEAKILHLKLKKEIKELKK